MVVFWCGIMDKPSNSYLANFILYIFIHAVIQKNHLGKKGRSGKCMKRLWFH